MDRFPTAQEKQGKWPQKLPIMDYTGNLEMLPKHRELYMLKLLIPLYQFSFALNIVIMFNDMKLALYT